MYEIITPYATAIACFSSDGIGGAFANLAIARTIHINPTHAGLRRKGHKRGA